MKQQKSSQQSCVCFFFRFIFLFRQSFGVFFESSTIARGASFFSSNICLQEMAEKKWPYSKLYTFFFGVGCVSNIFLLFRGLAATLACKYNKKQSAKACASSWSETWKFLYFQRLGKLGRRRKKTKRIKKTCFRCVGCVVMKGFWLKDVRCCCTYVVFFCVLALWPLFLSGWEIGSRKARLGALKMGDFGIAKVLSCTLACVGPSGCQFFGFDIFFSRRFFQRTLSSDHDGW